MIAQLSPSRLTSWADNPVPPDRPLLYRAAHQCIRIACITVQEFKNNELSFRAAALTFTVMLSLVPILAMSTAVVKGLGGGDQLKGVVYSYIANFDQDSDKSDPGAPDAPATSTKKKGSDLTQHLYSAIDQVFAYVDRTNFAKLGTFGVAGIFISVILVLGNIELVMNTIWHVESSRSIMRKIADYLTLLVLMPFSVTMGLAAGTVLKSDNLLSMFTSFLQVAWLQALILKLIPVLFLALTLYIVYLFFPNTKVKTIPAMAGALFAGFFWFEVQNLYIYLQIGVSKYNAIYGSFATLPLFLVWIYCGWIFILLGAQIAFAFQNRDSFRLNATNAPASLELAIAYDLVDYVENRFEKQEPATIDHFTIVYPQHNQTVVGEVVDKLKSGGIIHRSEDDGSLKPSIPKEHVDHKRIVDIIVGAIYGETEGGKRSSRVLGAITAPLSTPIDELEKQG